MKSAQNMLKFLLILLFSSLICSIILKNYASATSIFDDDFSNPVLDSAWQIDPGIGSYSLTSNPGNLRYNLKGKARASYIPPAGGWGQSLGIYRTFEGSNWILQAKGDYNLYYLWSGCQSHRLIIVFNDNEYFYFDRLIDMAYCHNLLRVIHERDGATIDIINNLIASDDVVSINNWISYAYWYEIEKNNNELTMRYSYDGITYEDAFTASLGTTVVNTQKVLLDSVVYKSAGSHVDWDYISASSASTVVPEPATCLLFVFGLVGMVGIKKKFS